MIPVTKVLSFFIFLFSFCPFFLQKIQIIDNVVVVLLKQMVHEILL